MDTILLFGDASLSEQNILLEQPAANIESATLCRQGDQYVRAIVSWDCAIAPDPDYPPDAQPPVFIYGCGLRDDAGVIHPGAFEHVLNLRRGGHIHVLNKLNVLGGVKLTTPEAFLETFIDARQTSDPPWFPSYCARWMLSNLDKLVTVEMVRKTRTEEYWTMPVAEAG